MKVTSQKLKAIGYPVPQRPSTPVKRVVCLFLVCLLLVSLVGCDAFVRKFTRKRKKEAPKELMVLVPEVYKPPQQSKEEVYRQYFLFWKSWHDELINALSQSASQKKQIDCVNETLKNLEHLRTTLQAVTQKKLDVYINQLENLKGSIVKDLYANKATQNRLVAERIKRNILHDFSYRKIKDHLI